jgi:dTDP-4-amino-4,6-dideoxygalactose transaminase
MTRRPNSASVRGGAGPELALLGGRPAFETPIHVGRPNLGNRDRFLEMVNAILDDRRLTNRGPFVRRLETELSERTGVKHCIAVCNATAGLEILIRALNLTGEVLVPSFTFVATAHALQWQGVTPVFCDIDPATHNLDPARVEAAVTPRTTGILGVHVWGRPCAVEALQAIADARGLTLLFDAAHAFGCAHRGRSIGHFGRAEVFSFHATKFFNTLEGGAIATDDDGLAARIRLMVNFGFTGYDEVSGLGVNGKMNEISAAMGLANLESLDAFIGVNRGHQRRYREALAGIPGLSLLPIDADEARNCQYVVAEVDAEAAGLSRDALVRVLHAENVLARRYFWPGCHRMEPYRTLYPDAGLRLPETERVAERVLVLPCGSAVRDGDIDIIGRILAEAVGRPDEVRRRLETLP